MDGWKMILSFWGVWPGLFSGVNSLAVRALGKVIIHLSWSIHTPTKASKAPTLKNNVIWVLNQTYVDFTPKMEGENNGKPY